MSARAGSKTKDQISLDAADVVRDVEKLFFTLTRCEVEVAGIRENYSVDSFFNGLIWFHHERHARISLVRRWNPSATSALNAGNPMIRIEVAHGDHPVNAAPPARSKQPLTAEGSATSVWGNY